MITQKKLREILKYDPRTGIWRWRVYRGGGAPPAGAIAGSINGQGYREIKIGQKTYEVGRLSFLWMMGRWPLKTIDHINCVLDDNRWRNLREATRQEQCRNRPGWSKHGVKGV